MDIIKIYKKTTKTIKETKRNFVHDGQIIKIQLNEITTIPELENVFSMDSEVKNRIKQDMVINGFSKAKPIHIFWWEGKWVLCDGHTRYTAATEIGLDKIYAQVHSFKNINEAVLYSMKEQFNRRNIQDSELFKNFEILRQQEIDGRKLTVTEMSERLNKSKRHIFKLQEVFEKSSKEDLQKIRDGLVTINHVYNEIKKKENSEGVSVKSNENKVFSKKQIKQLTDKQILLLGAKYALIQMAKGKSAEQILDTNIFPDAIKATDISFDNEDIELLKAM